MKKSIFYLFTGVFLSIYLMATASALNFEAGDSVVISENVLDDAYIAAGTATIDANIFGDLYIAGGSVTINGNIHEDLVVAGGNVVLTGDVFGDMRIMGGNVSIYGKISDDLVISGGNVLVSDSSIVGGTLMVAAGELIVDGEIQEDLKGATGNFTLSGRVDGDVDVTVKADFDLLSSAVIGGNLTYTAPLEGTIPAGVVAGKVTFEQYDMRSLLMGFAYGYLLYKLLSLVAALILALLFVLYVPTLLEKSAKTGMASPSRSFVVGLVYVIASVVVASLLMPTVVGIPISVILMAALCMAMILGKIFAAAWIAGYFYDFKKKLKKGKLFGVMALVLFGYFIVSMIPMVGWFARAIICMIGIGVLVQTKWEHLKFLRSKKMI